ncbi:MAG: VOC family protein [Alphaproteobacteria bacterium]|nr:VOC family protein [Alphaproteobacteria bacterium]
MRLNQVTVSVRELAPSIAFYRTLGLKLIVRNDHYARFECPDGGSTFSLHLNAAARGGNETTIYFENDQLDDVVARLKGAGLQFEADPVDQTWQWREAYLRDPTGNRICLYKAGEIRRFPPWRLSDAEATK